MAKRIYAVDFPAKYCRDERWDVVNRALEHLDYASRDKLKRELSRDEINKAFLAAGARPLEVAISPNKPRMQMRSMALAGNGACIRLELYDDGSIKVVQTDEELTEKSGRHGFGTAVYTD
jgi:hypothetical protein